MLFLRVNCGATSYVLCKKHDQQRLYPWDGSTGKQRVLLYPYATVLTCCPVIFFFFSNRHCLFLCCYFLVTVVSWFMFARSDVFSVVPPPFVLLLLPLFFFALLCFVCLLDFCQDNEIPAAVSIEIKDSCFTASSDLLQVSGTAC